MVSFVRSQRLSKFWRREGTFIRQVWSPNVPRARAPAGLSREVSERKRRQATLQSQNQAQLAANMPDVGAHDFLKKAVSY